MSLPPREARDRRWNDRGGQSLEGAAGNDDKALGLPGGGEAVGRFYMLI